MLVKSELVFHVHDQWFNDSNKSRVVLFFLNWMEITEFRNLFCIAKNSSFKNIIEGIGTCLNGNLAH